MKLTTLFLSVLTLSVTGCVYAIPSPTERRVTNVQKVPATGSSAGPQPPFGHYLTNAERIKKGLPLNPPHRRSVSLVPRSPQPTPAIGTTGQLFVMFADASMSGYVSRTRDEQGRYVVTKDASQAVRVRVHNHQLSPTNGDGEYASIGATFGHSYQASPEGPGNNAFDTNSYNFAAITGIDDGEHREMPHSGETSYVPAPTNFIEPAIFNLNSQTGEITATWINPDLTPRPATFGTSGAGTFPPLFVSANINMFNAMHGGFPARVFLV